MDVEISCAARLVNNQFDHPGNNWMALSRCVDPACFPKARRQRFERQA